MRKHEFEEYLENKLELDEYDSLNFERLGKNSDGEFFKVTGGYNQSKVALIEIRYLEE